MPICFGLWIFIPCNFNLNQLLNFDIYPINFLNLLILLILVKLTSKLYNLVYVDP